MTSLVRNICLEKTRWFYWQNSENWFSNWWLNLISKSSTFKIAFFCFLSKLFHCKASLLLRNVCHLNSVKMLDFEQFDQASILMVKTMICRIIWRNLGSYFNFNDSIADLTLSSVMKLKLSMLSISISKPKIVKIGFCLVFLDLFFFFSIEKYVKTKFGENTKKMILTSKQVLYFNWSKYTTNIPKIKLQFSAWYTAEIEPFLEWQPCHSSVMVLCSLLATYLGFCQWLFSNMIVVLSLISFCS